MELFVKVIFWLHLVVMVLGIMDLMHGKYPRPASPKTLGGEVAGVLVCLVFVMWAAFVLWA